LAPETHKREIPDGEVSYEREYVEEELAGGLLHPVQSPQQFVKISVSGSNQILWFLAISSVICLGALVLAPVPIVQGTVITIWLGSLTFARKVLRSVSRHR